MSAVGMPNELAVYPAIRVCRAWCSHPQCPITPRHAKLYGLQTVLPGQVLWYYILLLVRSAHYLLLWGLCMLVLPV